MSRVDFRGLRATGQFLQHLLVLREVQMDTPALEMVKKEVQRLHQQIAARYHASEPWSPQNRGPVKGLILLGRPGSSITYCLEKALGALIPIELDGGRSVPPKPLLMDVPDYGTTPALSRNIIDRVRGGEMARAPDAREANHKVLSALTKAKLTLLALDRAHRLLNPDRHSVKHYRSESHLFWEQTIAIMTDPRWSTPVVVAGQQIIASSIDMEDPIDKRRKVREEAFSKFSFLRLPDLNMGDEAFLIESVQKYCKKLGIRAVNSLFSADLAKRLVHASNYSVGTALVLAQEACVLAAVRPDSKGLKGDDFTDTYASWAGCGDEANPFISPNWPNIDTGRIAPRTYDEAKVRTK